MHTAVFDKNFHSKKLEVKGILAWLYNVAFFETRMRALQGTSYI